MTRPSLENDRMIFYVLLNYVLNLQIRLGNDPLFLVIQLALESEFMFQ